MIGNLPRRFLVLTGEHGDYIMADGEVQLIFQKTMQATSFEKPLFGKYELRSKLKTGGFGSVYRAKPIAKSDPNQYAIKVLPIKNEAYATIEYNMYLAIQKAQFTSGFVKHYQYGKVDGKICLVMELVGQDLEDLMARVKSKQGFSTKTGLMIGLQAIDRLEAIHKIGYLHRDIKPDNFTIGLNDKSATIYLIDFGLSKKISAPLPKQQKGKVVGTLAYMSCHVHEGKEAGILDDIESFLYTIIYLINGDLPWMSIQVQQPADYHRIKLMKQKLNKSWFLKNGIPLQLLELLEMCRSANRNAKFDYLQVKYKFMNALADISAENDFKFDWCKGNARGESQKKIVASDNINLKKMNEENQRIVQNQIYQIYKFMDNEDGHERKQEKKPSPKKIKEHPKIEEAERLKKKEMQAKQAQLLNKGNKLQTAAKPKRPASSNQRPSTRQKEDPQSQLQKQLKLIESMKCTGPRIVINRTAVHKI